MGTPDLSTSGARGPGRPGTPGATKEYDDVTDTTADLGQQVFRLVYRSRTTMGSENRPAELEEIFEVSRRKNHDLGLSGALLVWQDTFVQVLEGDEARVRDLYATIAADQRHEKVETLDEGVVSARAFGLWAMAHVSDDEGADLPAARGAEATDAPHAIPRLEDRRQEMLLDLMREYANPEITPL
ncbi:BLUF domain-containing protein [Actinomycetospora sp. NBRC 106378]|uniref:BLUF domain-containing protein n=1 Tax=Actinomycetospora sp. NBRC 106378 TaxID=3032208 RepID=UPI002553AD86|nr:BLUF domain-containing protein [Actinomycetospora sp. NBRC 106378]